MKDRLLQLLNKTGLSATKLADEINVQRSGISHILSGRNQPSFDFLAKILTHFPDIDAEWLILGKGNMIKKQENFTRSVRSDPTVEYKVIPTNADLFSETVDTNVTPDPVIKSTNEITNVTFITRVILLNSDGTFDVYNQSEKD